MGFALILFLTSDKLVNNKYVSQMIPKDALSTATDKSKGDALAIQFVGRMSFILLLFHSLVFLIILERGEFAANFHDGCWCVKAFLIAGGYIASWWIPSSFFIDFYLPAAKYASVIFLMY